jgi:hypothetical protein
MLAVLILHEHRTSHCSGIMRSVTFEAVVGASNDFRIVRYYYILCVLYSISWTTGAHLGMILHLVRSDYGPNVIFSACGQKGVWPRTDLLCENPCLRGG